MKLSKLFLDYRQNYSQWLEARSHHGILVQDQSHAHLDDGHIQLQNQKILEEVILGHQKGVKVVVHQDRNGQHVVELARGRNHINAAIQDRYQSLQNVQQLEGAVVLNHQHENRLVDLIQNHNLLGIIQ